MAYSKQWDTGPWFNTKMSSYHYRKSHCGHKMILPPSYLHNGIFCTSKTASLYWIGAQASLRVGVNDLCSTFTIDLLYLYLFILYIDLLYLDFTELEMIKLQYFLNQPAVDEEIWQITFKIFPNLISISLFNDTPLQKLFFLFTFFQGSWYPYFISM